MFAGKEIRGSLKSLAVQRQRVIQLSLSHQLLTLLNELGLLLLAAWSLREYTRDRHQKYKKSSENHGGGRVHELNYLTMPLALNLRRAHGTRNQAEVS